MAQHVTVTVCVSGFYYQGRYFRRGDELEVPADVLGEWIEVGHVRLRREELRDVRNIVAAFDRGQPISRR